MGQRVQDGWADLARKHGLDISVGGIAPLGHFGFRHPEPMSLKTLFVQKMLERGFLASNLFYAMFAHTQAEVDAYLEAADGVFGDMAVAVRKGSVGSELAGTPAGQGFARLT